eukprot:SAG11_NODE_1422_length_4951_cov_4.752112_5_plen_141_part_00
MLGSWLTQGAEHGPQYEGRAAGPPHPRPPRLALPSSPSLLPLPSLPPALPPSLAPALLPPTHRWCGAVPCADPPPPPQDLDPRDKATYEKKVKEFTPRLARLTVRSPPAHSALEALEALDALEARPLNLRASALTPTRAA